MLIHSLSFLNPQGRQRLCEIRHFEAFCDSLGFGQGLAMWELLIGSLEGRTRLLGRTPQVGHNGIFPPGMSASEPVLSDEEIWSIVLFIRHLPPAGSQGEPAMYNGDSCDPKSQKPPEGH
jgi:hypothetical protein